MKFTIGKLRIYLFTLWADFGRKHDLRECIDSNIPIQTWQVEFLTLYAYKDIDAWVFGLGLINWGIQVEVNL